MDRSTDVPAVCKGVLDVSVDVFVSEIYFLITSIQAVFSAFGLDTETASNGLVMCALHIKSFNDYYGPSSSKDNDKHEPALPAFEPNVQGSLLLQSLLHLPEPHNTTITNSILSLPVPQLLLLAQHPISSRIIDVLLESPSVPARARRRLILAFVPHFPALVDDRVGSRVGERLWGKADVYLKEKVARAVVPFETKLVGSRYGKYFVRGLDLYLLKRDPEAWKERMVVKAGAGGKGEDRSGANTGLVAPPVAPANVNGEGKERTDAGHKNISPPPDKGGKSLLGCPVIS